MSIPEAIKGARAEFARISSPIEKLRRGVIYARIIVAELLGTLQIAPFGLRAALLHRSLPSLEQWHSKKHQGVSIVQNLRYGPRARCVMDIYVPPNLASTLNSSTNSDGVNESQEQQEVKAPTVLFCHGGIWATGEKWHYAPMATRLAQAGIITAVMQYTLYPDALAQQMASEVSSAFSYLLDSIPKYGGDAKDVSLVGHSAGSQLCAMALIHKAFYKRDTKSNSSTSGQNIKQPSLSISATDKQTESTKTTQYPILHDSSPPVIDKNILESIAESYQDSRMPTRFISMAGVFDIGKHLEYEKTRDVHELSTMARAVGGAEYFESQSPTVILQRAHDGSITSHSHHTANTNTSDRASNDDIREFDTMKSYNDSSSFNGEYIASRVGLGRVNSRQQTAEDGQKKGSAKNEKSLSSSSHAVLMCKALPPTILQSSISDVTVPWVESAEMHWALHDCGVPVKSLVYPATGHGDFVTSWRPLPTIGVSRDVSDLEDFAADFVKIILNQ